MKRIAIARITTDLLKQLLTGNHPGYHSSLPEDVRIINVYQDPADVGVGLMRIVMESERFLPVPEGGTPPQLTIRMREREFDINLMDVVYAS